MSDTRDNGARPGRRGEPPASEPGGADLVVVGGGLAGLLGGWRAAAAGAEVIVLDDPARPAAVEVAAGMIAPVGEATWGEEALHSAAVAAARAWPEFAEAVEAAAGLPVPYRRCGALHVALDRDEAAALRRRGDLHERLGLRAENLLGSACREVEPGLATVVSSGTLAPDEAEVDPRALMTALRAAAERAGVRLLAEPAASIDSATAAVHLGSGRALAAGRVLIAAGAWAGEEGLVGGGRLPIRPVRGEILRLRAAAGPVPCERIIVGERFYVVPRADGEVVVGATAEERGFDLRVTAGGVFELLREAYRALPELAELELVESAVGLRPGSPDNAPIFGRLPVEADISVAGGLYRNGVLLAPLLAAGFDALAAGRPPAAELGALGPGRFDRLREEGSTR